MELTAVTHRCVGIRRLLHLRPARPLPHAHPVRQYSKL